MLYQVYNPEDDSPLGEIELDLDQDDEEVLDALIQAGYLHGDAEEFEIDDHISGAMEGIIVTKFEDDTEVLEVLAKVDDSEDSD